MRGSSGVLRVKAAQNGGKTVLDDCYFQAPYKVARPFWSPGGMMELMVMNASAGILEGDDYRVGIHVGSGSRVLITDQSYTKIFNTGNGSARKTVTATVEKGALLEYLPKPVIPFRNSNFSTVTKIDIQEGGSLVYRDILSCGRIGMGEKFAFSRYTSLLDIRCAGRRILHENICMEPEKLRPDCLGVYEGFTHQAELFFLGRLCPDEESCVQLLAAIPDLEFGLTRTLASGLILRLLGKSSDRLERVCDAVLRCAISATSP